jgi:ribosomal-protein-alanine N-acetyltransferase
LELERSIPEAPHWEEAEYWAMLGDLTEDSVLSRLFVAEDAAGRVLGFAGGRVAGSREQGERWGAIETVAVSAAARRLGLGRALCEAVLRWCEAEGAGRVELEVRAASAGAIALYRELGFVEEGRRKGYYREPVDDAVLMRRD